MIRKYHDHKLQTNPWHREEEPHNNHETPGSFNYFKMHAWSSSMLLLLHSAFMLRVVKMLLKGEVGGRALDSHRNYIVDHGKSWKNYWIVFLNFCGNPA